MPSAELVLVLLAAVTLLAALAERTTVPYPIFLVLGGLALVDLRDRGAIGDEALRRIEHDLDLEELHSEV